MCVVLLNLGNIEYVGEVIVWGKMVVLCYWYECYVLEMYFVNINNIINLNFGKIYYECFILSYNCKNVYYILKCYISWGVSVIVVNILGMFL